MISLRLIGLPVEGLDIGLEEPIGLLIDLEKLIGLEEPVLLEEPRDAP